MNFLRDLREDLETLGRSYFPEVSLNKPDEKTKAILVEDIEKDFATALEGIRKLPDDSRLAVMVAYRYYTRLLKNIKKTPAQELMKRRIRVSDSKKVMLLVTSVIKHKLNLE